MYGERLGDGVEYHLRRGVLNFLKMGLDPSPPPLMCSDNVQRASYSREHVLASRVCHRDL